jgi:hypothetical protein
VIRTGDVQNATNVSEKADLAEMRNKLDLPEMPRAPGDVRKQQLSRVVIFDRNRLLEALQKCPEIGTRNRNREIKTRGVTGRETIFEGQKSFREGAK